VTTESEPVPRPAQFALWHLFALLLVASVILALVTQLFHVGLVAAIYVTSLAIGWWRGRWRLAAASATALGVYAVTLLAAWFPLGDSLTMDNWAHFETDMALNLAGSHVARYEAEKGEFPESLQHAAEFIGETEIDLRGDGWRHPLHYRKTAEGFELASFGRDGIRGGAGLDADVYWTGYSGQRTPARLPLGQFLLETKSSGIVVWVAALASLIGGAIWYLSHQSRPSPKREWLISMVATAALAVIVATFLATFHVAASQSGH
jgi:hypothetical protein